MNDDAKDAARWRALKSLLHVSWSHREWWETVSEKGNRRTEEKHEEWFWTVVMHDELAELCGSVKAHKDIPTLDAALDAFIAGKFAAGDRQEKA